MTDGIDLKALKSQKTVEYKINGDSLFDKIASTFDKDAHKGILSKKEFKKMKEYLSSADNWEDPNKPYGERINQRDGFLVENEIRAYAAKQSKVATYRIHVAAADYKHTKDVGADIIRLSYSSAILKRLGVN